MMLLLDIGRALAPLAFGFKHESKEEQIKVHNDCKRKEDAKGQLHVLGWLNGVDVAAEHDSEGVDEDQNTQMQ